MTEERNKEVLLKSLDFIEERFREIRKDNESRKSFNWALFYGLIFGLVGNTLVTAFFAYFRDSITDYLFIIISIGLIILMIFIWIVILENNKTERIGKELSDKINQVLADKDAIDNGKLEPNKSVLDKYLR